MKENELAIEKGIKGEIAEDFIGGLKQLFEDHYIDVPDEKYDILDAKEKEVEELKGKINEMTKKEIETKKVINEFTKDEILEEITSGLADTEVEKLKSLVNSLMTFFVSFSFLVISLIFPLSSSTSFSLASKISYFSSGTSM
jgi:c-di-AMP phosphodiesterase-like protein